MKESIKTTVVQNSGDTEMELEIVFDGDVLTFIDGDTRKELFSGDWTANFAEVFGRAIEIWPIIEEN